MGRHGPICLLGRVDEGSGLEKRRPREWPGGPNPLAGTIRAHSLTVKRRAYTPYQLITGGWRFGSVCACQKNRDKALVALSDSDHNSFHRTVADSGNPLKKTLYDIGVIRYKHGNLTTFMP